MLRQNNRLHFVADLHVELVAVDEELADYELLQVLDFEDRRAIQIFWLQQMLDALVGFHSLQGSVKGEENEKQISGLNHKSVGERKYLLISKNFSFYSS